jgi:hypothetical protein
VGQLSFQNVLEQLHTLRRVLVSQIALAAAIAAVITMVIKYAIG